MFVVVVVVVVVGWLVSYQIFHTIPSKVLGDTHPFLSGIVFVHDFTIKIYFMRIYTVVCCVIQFQARAQMTHTDHLDRYS